MEEVIAPFGNFFRSLKLRTRLDLDDEKWVYTEEPHVERRKVCFLYFLNFQKTQLSPIQILTVSATESD
ncbi:hypothetical protein ACTXT7_005515 [Hymenolepis weldensis]